tara:strand:+ start:227 stop:481 length:255 start_codon:yes stop_codon:yes gene_type:complete
MKLTKAKLKQIIKEEIGMLEQAGHERGEFKVSDLMANVDGYPAGMHAENQLGVAIYEATKLAVTAGRTDVEEILESAREALMGI